MINLSSPNKTFYNNINEKDMRKEFNNLVMLLQQKPYSNDIAIAIQKLENKIDEVEKRINCAVQSAQEANDSISIYTQKVDNGEAFKMDIRDHYSILRATNDISIALDLNDTECIENNWYNLFNQLQPIAVGKIEYDFPEEVYSIGNADNTEIIGDVYESVFKLLLQGTVVITENDKGFTSGKTNYIITHEQFIPLIKFHQIDLSKVPIKNEAPTMLCQDKDKHDAVKDIIAKLKEIEVDGETMQYILDQVGMSEQIAKQLSNEIF